MLSISDAFQQHMWKHRQGRGEWSVIPAAHQCVLGKVPVCSTGSPRRFTSSSVPQTVFSPQDHADSGLPHGPEELPHGRTDVHHAVRKLWVLSTSPSLPSPSPAATHSQFSLHWRFAQEPLAQDFPFIQHMWHFLKKPNLKRSHMRCPGLLVFTLAFCFGGKRESAFSCKQDFFSLDEHLPLVHVAYPKGGKDDEQLLSENEVKLAKIANSSKSQIQEKTWFVADDSLHTISAPVQVITLAFITCTSSFASTQMLFITALSRKARIGPCLQA